MFLGIKTVGGKNGLWQPCGCYNNNAKQIIIKKKPLEPNRQKSRIYAYIYIYKCITYKYNVIGMNFPPTSISFSRFVGLSKKTRPKTERELYEKYQHNAHAYLFCLRVQIQFKISIATKNLYSFRNRLLSLFQSQ